MSSPVPLDLAGDIWTRRNFGLATDPAYVRAVDAAPDSTKDQLGIPLTPAEHADIAHRDRLEAFGLKAIEKVQGLPGFAGAWFDQLDHGALHIASTGPDLSPTVRAVTPAGYAVHYDRVRWSLGELDTVTGRIGTEGTRRTTIGRSLQLVTTDEPTNAVDVEIRVDAPRDAEAVLRRAYPQPFVHITRATGPIDTLVATARPNPSWADQPSTGRG